jgi:hypothetical protein
MQLGLDAWDDDNILGSKAYRDLLTSSNDLFASSVSSACLKRSTQRRDFVFDACPWYVEAINSPQRLPEVRWILR